MCKRTCKFILVILIFYLSSCDNYQHNTIVNTNPANFINIDYTKSYGGNGNDWGTDIISTPESDILISGISDSYGYGTSSMYLIKAEIDGNRKWSYFYGGWGQETGEALVYTNDSLIYIGGMTSSFDMSTGGKVDPATNPYYLFDEYNFYLVNTNMNGITIWEKAYGSLSANEYCTDIALAEDGIILVGNKIIGVDSDVDIYIVKVDFDGTVLWEKTISTSNIEKVNSVVTTSDGGCILAGSIKTNRSENNDFYFCKMNNTGDIIWEKRIGETEFDESASAIIESAGGFIVCGDLRVPTDPDLSKGILYVLRLELNGDLSWTYSYLLSKSQKNKSITATIEGTFIICGFNQETKKIAITKIKENGQFLWSEIDGNCFAQGIINFTVNSEDSYLITGAQDNPENTETNDVLLIKITEDKTNIE